MRLFMRMMRCSLVHCILVLCQLRLTKTQRRIVDGRKLDIDTEVRYMAYLLKAHGVSEAKYDAWICGGAIVNDRAIITSAACIEDVQYMYAVVGHKKYVKSQNIKTEACTKNARKRVVLSCVPKTYNFNYDDVEQWSNIDIGVVFVDSSFDFTKKVEGCTWRPDIIKVNYLERYQRPSIDAVIFGFGHTEKWRMLRDITDYNQPELQYASVMVMRRDECKKSYKAYKKLYEIIDKYMICTLYEGGFDASGKPLAEPRTKTDDMRDSCNAKDPDCIVRRQMERAGPDLKSSNSTGYSVPDLRKYGENETLDSTERLLSGRRLNSHYPGFCQNDHGGPLVTWIGNRPHLIAVASVFLVNPRDKKCNGPYLYTSTACNSKFLNCALKNMTDALIHSDNKKPDILRSNEPVDDEETRERRRIIREYDDWYEVNKDFCELPPEKRGFKMVARRYSWDNHPDRPDQYKEDLIERPQLSLNILRTLN